MIFAFFMGFIAYPFAAWAVQEAKEWASLRGRPVNEFCGKVFPHPLDENWREATSDERGRFVNGVVRVGGNNLYVEGHRLPTSGTQREIGRVEAYEAMIWRGLQAAHYKMESEKALEALERNQEQIMRLSIEGSK